MCCVTSSSHHHDHNDSIFLLARSTYKAVQTLSKSSIRLAPVSLEYLSRILNVSLYCIPPAVFFILAAQYQHHRPYEHNKVQCNLNRAI